ncbi:MAG TPA: FtsQ-type POTRA domain-containing protein [Candidatus Limnocylindrales bacterium]|nr:FtsQ-type POTRA domain-containing protein [Candidatus Limnocylindrales bacterium]
MARSNPVARKPAASAVRRHKPVALRPGARPGGGIRRTKPVRRASAGLTPVRAGAALALLVAAGGLYGAMSSDVFTARATIVEGNTWTPQDAILAALAVPDGANVFTMRTSDLEARLEQIPAVAGATVSIALPDQVRVQVAERQALLAWKVGQHLFLVAADGTLFGAVGDQGSDAAASLPVVNDRRIASAELGVGSKLDPVTLDAALRLGSLTPADVGSTGDAVHIRVDDENGFVLRGDPAGWNAVFGFYTPTLRTTDLIPGQVRLLRSLLLDPAHEETNVLRVILADERSGTWIPRTTPEPSASAKP